jgi:hypothetical protein
MFVLQGLENKFGKFEFKGMFHIMEKVNFYIPNIFSSNALLCLALWEFIELLK